jgi:DNA-binding NtrC family response regulator
VAELPLSTQVRLLRILQTGEFMRVGSAKTQKVDVRVVAATNISLPEAIAMGKFREDLYYRLNTVPIVVPPLRERREDIYLLFRKFAADIANQYRMPVVQLDEGARAMLEGYYWPGNVRQLKNVAEQISAVEETRLITPEILRKYIPVEHSTSPMMTSGGRGESFGDEREILYRILFDMRGDITEIKHSLAELRKRTDNIEHIEAERGEIAGLLPTRAGVSQYEYEEPEVVEEASSAEMTKEQALREAIVKALQKTGGKRKEAARMLFISERTLYRKIKELGIENY